MKLITNPLELKTLKSRALVLLECEYCGISFGREKKDVMRTMRSLEYKNKDRCKYCSKNCSNLSKVSKILCICGWCGVEFERVPSEVNKVKITFCSKSCSAKLYNSQKPKKEHSCRNCPTILKNRQRVYCTSKCQNAYLRRVKIDKWLSGEFISTSIGLPDFIRDYLLELNNYSCCQCGFTGINEKTGRSIIQIDHIDGNSINSVFTNLRALCPNCHAMTPTYGTLNDNVGRRTLIKNGGI